MNTETLEKQTTVNETPERLNNDTWYVPSADILEHNDGYTMNFDMPGVNPNDTDITFEDGVLTVEGRVARTADDNTTRNYLVREYGIGHFRRSFTIRSAIDSNAIKGELKNGQLTIHIPKAQAARTKKIIVRGD